MDHVGGDHAVRRRGEPPRSARRAGGRRRRRRPRAPARGPSRASRRSRRRARRRSRPWPAPGAPPRETARGPLGETTSVSSPLSTTYARALAAAARACSSRARPTSAESTSSSRPSSPACGVSTVGQRRCGRSSGNTPIERVEAVGVDHQRHVDALEHLQREVARARLLGQPGAEHHRVGAPDRLQRRAGRLAAQRAVGLGQPDHHRLEKPHRERELEACRRADRHVARAGAHGGQRAHRRRAGQPRSSRRG